MVRLGIGTLNFARPGARVAPWTFEKSWRWPATRRGVRAYGTASICHECATPLRTSARGTLDWLFLRRKSTITAASRSRSEQSPDYVGPGSTVKLLGITLFLASILDTDEYGKGQLWRPLRDGVAPTLERKPAAGYLHFLTRRMTGCSRERLPPHVKQTADRAYLSISTSLLCSLGT